MNFKKYLTGLALSVFILVATFMGTSKVNAAWNEGTSYGFSSDFYYQITNQYNIKITNIGAGTPTKVDEAKEAGGYRKLSEGTMWISKNWAGSIKVTNGKYNKSPITSVTASNSSIISVTRTTTGTLAQAYNEYNIKGLAFGSATVKVTRKNGDSFTIPVNVSKQISITNDERKTEKNVIMGLGQTIKPTIISSTDNTYNNKALVYQWTSDNSNVVSIVNGNQLYAKGKGTAIVRCKVYDCLNCYNKWHYSEGNTIMYSIKVQEDTPIIQLKDGSGELLNQKVKVKKVGEKINLVPTLPNAGSLITWMFESSDPNIASVDSLGVVTATGVGTATITVKGAEQKQSFTLNVTASTNEKIVELKNVFLNLRNITLGQKVNLLDYYSTNPANTKLYSFKASSSNSNVIEISGKNTLIAKSLGESRITLSVTDYKNNIRTSTVVVRVRLATPNITIKKCKRKNIIIIKNVSGAKKYLVYRSKNKNKKFKLIGDTKTTSYTDKVKSSKGYYYKVIASSGSNIYNSNFSNTVSTSIKRPKIKRITKKGSLYIVKLSGKKYDGFEVYYGTNKKCKKFIGVGKNKKFAIAVSLSKNKKYYFRVRSFEVIAGKKTKSKFSKIYKYKRK